MTVDCKPISTLVRVSGDSILNTEQTKKASVGGIGFLKWKDRSHWKKLYHRDLPVKSQTIFGKGPF